MMNNNHKNSGCGFAEELISYLYGESDAAQSAAFETHLQNCSACADELEAFSGVHFSINDWKLKDFANLETPVIEIPYEKAEKSVEVSSVTSSWLSALRDLFSLSPRGWSLATASLAVFAVGVGIVLIGLNSRTGNDVAGSNKTVKPASLPTVEKTPDQTVANSNQNSAPDRESKPLKEQKAPPEVAVEPNPKNNRAVKASNTQRQPQKTENTPKNNGVKNNKNEREVAPVIPDEDEDDSLRLAELFEEIDTDE